MGSVAERAQPRQAGMPWGLLLALPGLCLGADGQHIWSGLRALCLPAQQLGLTILQQWLDGWEPGARRPTHLPPPPGSTVAKITYPVL